ncbi:MAG: hypothetical protein ACJ8FU_08660 [Xanthobacteraceae bacterium]
MSGGIWGNVPLTEESGRYPTQPEQALASGLAKGLFTMVDYPRKVAAGESAVWNPETGHVSDEAIKWANDQAVNRLPTRVPVSAGEAVFGAGPIRAYHGSPHDFDRFDMSKIGTGEGAQAYGHGLYFAENEGVARNYRDMLSGPTATRADFSHPQLGNVSLDGLEAHLAGEASKAKVDRGTVDMIAANVSEAMRMGDDLAHMRRFVRSSDWDAPTKSAWDAALNAASSFDVARTVPQGRMYEVAIHADPERLLDWDKPLKAQSAPVQQAVEQFGLRHENPRPTGEDVYRRMRRYVGENIQSNRPLAEDVSATLREAGIPGLKYLDQGSRGVGNGSHNVVMFDDKLIEILRKYGLLGPLAGGTAAAAMPPGTEQ